MERCHGKLIVSSPFVSKTESLKDYVARFKVVMLKVYNLDKSMAMVAIKRELCISHFIYLLDKIHSKSYLKMLTHDRSTFAWMRDLLLSERSMESRRRSKPKKSQAEPEQRSLTHPVDKVPS